MITPGDSRHLPASQSQCVLQRSCRATRVLNLLNEKRLYAKCKVLKKAKVLRYNGLKRSTNQYRCSRTKTMMGECAGGNDSAQGFRNDELRCLVGKKTCLEGNTCFDIRVPVAVANNPGVGQANRVKQFAQPQYGFAAPPR